MRLKLTIEHGNDGTPELQRVTTIYHNNVPGEALEIADSCFQTWTRSRHHHMDSDVTAWRTLGRVPYGISIRFEDGTQTLVVPT